MREDKISENTDTNKRNVYCYKQENCKIGKILFFKKIFYLQCFNGDRIPKQSSSFSSPREINGSSSSFEELATDGSDLEARSCCITLKYSSSVFALANSDWAFDLWARNVFWALTSCILGARRPFEESQAWIVASDSLDCSSNLDHHLTLKVLCKISWVS